MAWQCVRNGTIRDPLTAEQVQQLFVASKITEETLVSHPQHTDWKWRRLSATPLYRTLKEAGEDQHERLDRQADTKHGQAVDP